MFSFITEGVGWEIPGKIKQNLITLKKEGETLIRANERERERERVISIKVTDVFPE